MRASRLLSLLMLLQAKGRVSAHALASALEVSVRTVYRDVDELSAAGVPIWADRGRHGGFQLQPGWRTRVDGLTAPEAQALFLAGLPGPAAELGLGEAMASAQLKMLAALPPDWRDDARRVGSRFHLDPLDWYRGPASSDHLPEIARAVWSDKRIAVVYESWKGSVSRRLDPLGLVLKAGIWYLAARSGASLRTYRLSSVVAVSVLEQPFQRPADFDLAGWWQASTRRFETGLHRETALLRVSAQGFQALRGLEPVVAAAALASAGEPDASGWRQVTIPIESTANAAPRLLALGAQVEVLRPAELRREMRALLGAMTALYERAC